MEVAEDDDDLKLVQASATLLGHLQDSLPKILGKRSKNDSSRRRVHSRVKRQDLDYVVRLIEPFQGEPQLLDAKLKDILPPIVEAYIQHTQEKSTHESGEQHIAFETAVCTLLYTLCKVRGSKIVLQFLNNEPRYLEPILARLEAVLSKSDTDALDWQVSYILLLWVSHLVLTPFDLASFSSPAGEEDPLNGHLDLQRRLPSIAERVLLVGLRFLCVSTKAQDAAALLLVRFATRPDMQKTSVADAVIAKMLQALERSASDVPVPIYEQLGPLRFLAGACSAPELSSLVPSIYAACQRLVEDQTCPILANAVAKKLVVKIFRNVAILSLRPLPAQSPLQQFSETTSILEDVIDYSLQALGDRDTPVRYAAAKALSLIILQLEPEMGHEVIQAILDSFQEDMPQRSDVLDFRDANALKWHGLTLALAHALFKRSASPDQLHDIVRVLVSALQFEQRTATGSSVGTNVRDAANFGIWALSRRYTTKELKSVSVLGLPGLDTAKDPKAVLQYPLDHRSQSVIQYLATQLILSACLDPAGNIRRGSSAAIQELIGRHPNEVYEGIALVQIVDYQAVGLRRRAMLDVAERTAELHGAYRTSLSRALFQWRGLGSPDVSSREAAAASLARLTLTNVNFGNVVLNATIEKFRRTASNDGEGLHGLALTLACLCEDANDPTIGKCLIGVDASERLPPNVDDACTVLDLLLDATKDFSLRMLRSELPSAIVRLLAALCKYLASRTVGQVTPWHNMNEKIEELIERTLTRHEDTILQEIPSLVKAFLRYKKTSRTSLGCLEAHSLCQRVELDASKTTLHGAGRAIALGSLTPWYNDGLIGENAASAVTTLSHLIGSANVDWRVIGVRALQLAVHSSPGHFSDADPSILDTMVKAMHSTMNDYTIDERGDVGSLVRLQGIACTVNLLIEYRPTNQFRLPEILHADIVRLSLEKLDRVRLAAAQCRHNHLGFELNTTDIASVSSQTYFEETLRPLATDEPVWIQSALLEGVISCAGISAEPLLQASRAALVDHLSTLDTTRLHKLLTILANILKSMLTQDTNSMHAALELLGFLLDMQIPQRLVVNCNKGEGDFNWRNLLSTVQKSHYKSNDIPKILTAIHVYRNLAEISVIRAEVLKKLLSMLKTNPYPRIRLAVAETLFAITKDTDLKERDWFKPASQHRETIHAMERKYLM